MQASPILSLVEICISLAYSFFLSKTSKIFCTRCKNIEVNFIFLARLFVSLR